MKKIISVIVLLFWCIVVFSQTTRAAVTEIVHFNTKKELHQNQQQAPFSQKGKMCDLELEETSESHEFTFLDFLAWDISSFPWFKVENTYMPLSGTHPVLVNKGSEKLIIIRILRI